VTALAPADDAADLRARVARRGGAPVRRHSVNLPNALTAGRLLVVPVLVVVLATGLQTTSQRLLAFGLFSAACLTDVLDGQLARRRDQVTAFGVMAEPIADKALLAAALIGLSALDLLPWWVSAVVLARAVAVTVLRTVLLRHGLLPAHRGGKLKCLTQNTAVALYLLPLAGVWATAREPVMALAVVLTVATGGHYALSGYRLQRQVRSERLVRASRRRPAAARRAAEPRCTLPDGPARSAVNALITRDAGRDLVDLERLAMAEVACLGHRNGPLAGVRHR
jgi:CDP-diacylglycerol---glycerol-3-phosphate 3-phosphatidyltransferase